MTKALRLFLLLSIYNCFSLTNAKISFKNENFDHIQDLAQLDWQSIGLSLFSQDFLSSFKGNACVDELKLFVNNFLGERSVFLLLLDGGKFINELGSIENCESDHGRYYLVSAFQLAKLGLCVPSSCTEDDMNIFKRRLIEIANNIAKREVVDEKSIVFTDARKAKYPIMTKGTIFTFTIVIIVVIISIVASCATNFKSYNKMKGHAKNILDAFDIVKNAKSLLYSENRVDKNLDILNGVKTLSMGWISLAHFLLMISTAPIINILDLQDIFLTRPGYALFTSASLAVDVFFFLSGFLGILVCTEQIRNSKHSKILTTLLIYIHRYIRMLPVYGFAMLAVLYILPYLHNGTIYFTINDMKGKCDTDWVYNLLYINNLVERSNCCGWSWYIANDFQMYLLIPPLVIIYLYSPKLGYASVYTMMLASFSIQYGLLSYYDIGYFYDTTGSRDGPSIGTIYYGKPWCRINPFLIGIIFAWMYLSHKNKETTGIASLINNTIKNSIIFRYALYIIGFASTTVSVFIFFEFYKKGTTKSHFEHYIFVIFSRPGFILGLFMMIYPGCLGLARGIRGILSNDLFNVLSRIVFSAYMFNMIIIGFFNASREDGMYFTTTQLWLVSIDIFVLDYAVAFISTLLLEYPVISLSKEYLRPKRQAISKVVSQEQPEKKKILIAT